LWHLYAIGDRGLIPGTALSARASHRAV